MSTALYTLQESAAGAAEFLRSVNVVYDINTPERISHFHPTTKSIHLIDSLALSRKTENYLIVAPYGSGKSLLATFIAQVIENSEKSAVNLAQIVGRIPSAAIELKDKLSDRIAIPQIVRPSGLSVVLHGHQPDLGKAIANSFLNSLERIGLNAKAVENLKDFEGSVEDILQLLSDIKNIFLKEGIQNNIEPQRIVILWDEFGRHLEELVAKGEASKLSEIQLIAEYAARQQKTPVALALFLHQSLANYASNLSQSGRKEWKKIEGRFETVQFVDDSREITRLIADIVKNNRPHSSIDQAERIPVKKIASYLSEVGLFAEFKTDELNDLLIDSYPLEPATLYLLPRVSARVAQNERTLFSFLFSIDMRSIVTPEILFEYFSESMMTDTGIGGAYHHWLEIQNAIEKVTNTHEIQILKTAGLLGLGVSGHRSRVGKQLLTIASSGYSILIDDVSTIIEDLISRHLLLYRKSTDQVAIWHGVDIDLRGILEQEKSRIGLSFDFVSFLTNELPPKPWMPLEYNADYQVTRYFKAKYINTSCLGSALADATEELNSGIDGQILHILPDENEELSEIESILKNSKISDRILVTFPQHSIQIIDTALEVYTLRRMQEDDALVSEDPLVLPELKQMTDDALDYLSRVLSHAVDPCEDGPFWIEKQSTRVFRSAPELRVYLSELCRRIFPDTPRLNNELIVRNHPRQVIINARKKLIAAILDHHGEEDLGLDGYRPDRSMFRTILLNTRLYKLERDLWCFAGPEELDDACLSNVWSKFRSLVSYSSRKSKDLEGFFKELEKPPIGLRPGVYPILFSAALRAFPSSISITEKDIYVEDILPSTIEDICDRPWDFDFKVLNLGSKTLNYLFRLREVFTPEQVHTTETDHLRLTFDSLRRWLSELPPAAFTSRRVSEEAAALRVALSRISDPVELFLYGLPKLFKFNSIDDVLNFDLLKKAVREIEALVGNYYESAEATLRDALQLRSELDTCEEVERWTQYIPEKATAGISNSLAKAFHSRLTFNYDGPHRLIDSLASLLVQKTVNRWDDSTLTAFDRALRSAVSQLEEHALQVAKDEPELAHYLAELAKMRIKSLYGYLVEAVGADNAAKSLKDILEQEDLT